MGKSMRRKPFGAIWQFGILSPKARKCASYMGRFLAQNILEPKALNPKPYPDMGICRMPRMLRGILYKQQKP